MNWMPILIQLISGGVGGNIAGALLKRFNLGPIGNTIAGILATAVRHRRLQRRASGLVFA
jgi:uncharacterized membrane protein YeaQ/YmgE (transglycosylase-associated protein family)